MDVVAYKLAKNYAEGNAKHYWNPDPQPDILGNINSFGSIEWTSDQIITNIYEPLRAKYPNYITRSNIGKDSSGVYDMWCYIFEPKNYEQTVYLQSGVHPIETEGYWGLARFLTILCDNPTANKDIEYLRRTVRFIIVPMVSVYGISLKGTYANFKKNYSINHNSHAVNGNRDTVNQVCQETKNVIAILNQYKNEISFGLDLHTTTTETWGDYLLAYPPNTPNENTLLRTLWYLAYKNISGTPNIVFAGPNNEYPGGGVSGSFVDYMLSVGIPSGTVEHSDFIFDTELGTGKAMTKAVENFGNHIIQHCKDRWDKQKTTAVSVINSTPNLVVYDDFERADGVIGTTVTGQTWTVNGTIVIEGKKARTTLSQDGQNAIVDAGIKNAVVTTKLIGNTDYDCRIVLRYTDSSNYWSVNFYNGQIRLIKVVAGTPTITAYTITRASTSFIKVKCSSDNWEVYYNDKLVISLTDSFNNTATKFGFGFNSVGNMNGTGIDEFKVEAILGSISVVSNQIVRTYL